ncbi:hypothetical protein ACFXMT_21625 [Streptomyces mirabilis]|uniref:hypothetical protein n=1 Tax=Streptomyces mirabilis TaxID=68239 RepID=UPI003658A84D
MNMEALAIGPNGGWTVDEHLKLVVQALAERGYCAMPELPDLVPVHASLQEVPPSQ